MIQHSHEEIWKPIVGWEELYEVSDHGRVRSLDRTTPTKNGRTAILRGRVLRATANSNGYKIAILQSGPRRSAKRVHRLVLEAFVGPCPDGMQVCHSDGNRVNNSLGNLRYGTTSENRLDSVKHGTHPHASKTHCPRGHSLVPPNLVAALWRKKYRSCLACDRARGAIRTNPSLAPRFQEVADEKLAVILERFAA